MLVRDAYLVINVQQATTINCVGFLDHNFTPASLRRNIGLLGCLHKCNLGLCHPKMQEMFSNSGHIRPWHNRQITSYLNDCIGHHSLYFTRSSVTCTCTIVFLSTLLILTAWAPFKALWRRELNSITQTVILGRISFINVYSLCSLSLLRSSCNDNPIRWIRCLM